MSFDFKEYSEAIDNFLISMESVPDVQNPASQQALERICVLLRIAEIKIDFYDTLLDERTNNGQTIIVYQKGIPSETHHYQHREMTGGGNVAIYTISPIKFNESWSDEEFEKLRVLLKTLFVFHGRMRTAQMVEFYAFHESDLKMRNTAYYMRNLSTLIAQGRIDEYAACFFNLTRFSAVNQQVGRDRGTQVMLSFVNGLAKDFTPEECVCRVGGDNFVTLFLKERLDFVTNYLKGTEISSEGGPVKATILVSASAGYYIIPRGCNSAPEIMDYISAAVNIAKHQAKGSMIFYDEHLKERMKESKIIEELFPDALRQEEFVVYYQPKYNIKNNTIVGAEALCRWMHQGTMIMPGRFIPILEHNNTICQLDFYMLDHVCQDIRKWLDDGKPVTRISCNLSRCHFGNVNLLEDILSIIDKYEIPHEYIEIELTETTTDVNFRDLRRIVYGLKKQGISTSIDDFGIGYSSLNLVRELPWDNIKIDKSFLQEKVDSPHSNFIMLKHIIAMVKELGLHCIIEGVETPEQANILKENNCFLVQGFLYDKPLPKKTFEERLKDFIATDN